MTRLIDKMVNALTEMHYFITDLEYFSTYTILPLQKRYDAMRQQEVEEAKLAEENLTDEVDEPSDYTALSSEYNSVVANSDLPEKVDEWGQSYGRCSVCGMPWDIVRPGKGQPACECHA